MKNSNIYPALFSEVLVFKTNVSSDNEVEKVRVALSGEGNILRWNIDLSDIDKVLRIECDQLQPATIVELLREAGFECEELPD